MEGVYSQYFVIYQGLGVEYLHFHPIGSGVGGGRVVTVAHGIDLVAGLDDVGGVASVVAQVLLLYGDSLVLRLVSGEGDVERAQFAVVTPVVLHAHGDGGIARTLSVLHVQESVLAGDRPLPLGLDVEGKLMGTGLHQDVGILCLLGGGGQRDVGHIFGIVAAAASREGYYCDGQCHQASECSFHCRLV